METKKNTLMDILTGKWVRIGLYAAIAVLLNIAAVFIFFRVDLTGSRIYTLSEASKKTISSLTQPLTFQIFFTTNLPAPYNSLEQYLRDLLEEYSIYADRKYFNFKFNNVNSEEGKLSEEAIKNQELARSYGISQENVQVVKDDEVKFQMAHMGMAIIYGDMVETISLTNYQMGLEYKITSTINKLINKSTAILDLKEKIQVKLYLSSELYPAAKDLDKLPVKMEEIIKNLNAKNYNKFEYHLYDLTNNPDKTAEAEQLAILSFSARVSQDPKNTATKKLYAGLVLQYGEKTEKMTIVDYMNTPFGLMIQPVNLEQLEEKISGTVENLIDINMNIGVVTSHGTLPLTKENNQQNFNPYQGLPETNFSRLLKEVYSIKQINLKEEEIPSEIECLVIAGPKEQFSEYELFKIDQFLMKGKSLAVFLDGIKEEKQNVDPQMAALYGGQVPTQYVPLATGLETLLASYGATVEPGYLYDESCFVQQSKQAGSTKVYFAPKIQSGTINQAVSFMQNINELILVLISPLKIDVEKIKLNGLTDKILFSSSDKGWMVKDNISLDPGAITPPLLSTDKKSLPVACVVEGEFPSYFKGREAPAKPVKEGQEKKESLLSTAEVKPKVTEKGAYGRLFLMGSGQALRDDYTFTDDFPQNYYLVINSLDYLNGRSDYAVMRTKNQQNTPLNPTTPEVKNFTKFFNWGAVPLLVILVGIFVFLRRKARRGLVQKKFSKQERI